MSVTRKSMLNLNVVVGGIDISEGGGENDFITTTAPERFSGKSGVHDDGVLYDTPNVIYEVKIALLETAAANLDLQGLFAQQVDDSGLMWVIQIEDTGTTEEFTGKGLITKEPDRVKTAECQNYEWTLKVVSRLGWTYRSRGAVT